MSHDRSDELDRVRRLLFPDLPADEGWARVEGAIAGAADEERAERIERIASEELDEDLLALLRLLHRRRESDCPKISLRLLIEPFPSHR